MEAVKSILTTIAPRSTSLASWRSALAGGFLLAMAGAGCAEDETAIVIRGVLAGDDECLYSADPESATLSRGSLDVLGADSYRPWVLVENQVIRQGNAERLRAETSELTLYAAEVTILDADGAVLDEYEKPIAGFSEEHAGTTHGFAAAAVPMIDTEARQGFADLLTKQCLSVEVTVEVVVRGRTLGQNEVKSRPFAFPVLVCSGCMVADLPKDDKDPCKDESYEDGAISECRQGQDGKPYKRCPAHPCFPQ